MNEPSRRISRKAALAVVALPVLGAAVAGTQQAAEAAKSSQAAVKYQNKPKNGQKCSGCRFFTPPGACQIVAGKISPNGWCVAFAAKS